MHYPPDSIPGPDNILRETLPNGITILARENFASPAVVITGHVHAGAQDESARKRGLANFCADVMERGTQHRTCAALYEEIESIGASFGVSAGTHITGFGAKGLAEHLGLLLDWINDTLRYPAFDTEQVEKIRAEILAGIRERPHSTHRMASAAFYEMVYPESHPYHWCENGYVETVEAITREDLVSFHAQQYQPKGAIITIVGGIEARRAFETASELLGAWYTPPPERPALVAVPPLAKRTERRMEIEDKVQSSVILGWPGPARADPDYMAVTLANTILGVFGMHGRLGKSVREQNSLAYYAGSHVDGGAGPGPWRIEAGTEPGAVDRVVELALAEVHRLQNEPVPAEELADNQSHRIGALPLRLETNEGMAMSISNIELYQLGLDYLQRYPDIISAITAEDIQRVARQWMDVERYALAVAGPAGAEV